MSVSRPLRVSGRDARPRWSASQLAKGSLMSDVTNTGDPLGARSQLTTSQGTSVTYYRLQKLVEEGLVASLERLPFTVRILLENVLRNYGGEFVEEAQLKALAGWSPGGEESGEFPFLPARVVLQDF